MLLFGTRRIARGFVLTLLGILPAFAQAPAPPENVQAGFEQRTFTLPDGKQMTVSQRHGEGPALVLVPGTWGDIQRFAPLVSELPVTMPVTVIELCWQGGHVPPTLDLTIENCADDVLWVIDELKFDRFYFGGHSIGGMIAVEIAGREVPGLIGVIPMEGWTHHSVVDTAFDGVVTGPLTPAQQEQSERSRADGRAHLSEEQLAVIGTIWTAWNGYEALMRADVPILHVWGDRGKPHPDRTALQIPDKSSIEIAWMPGASHPLVMQTPKALADAIMDFMKRHP
jgi:pimeloyl-ACP methyl ester carboxylesterase